MSESAKQPISTTRKRVARCWHSIESLCLTFNCHNRLNLGISVHSKLLVPAAKLTAKAAKGIAAGGDVACVVEPKEEFVLVDTPDAAPRQLSGDELLELPDVLPGFSIREREFF